MAFDQQAFNTFVVDSNVYGFFPQAITLKSGRTSHFYANWRDVVKDVWSTERLAGFVIDFVRDLGLQVDTFYGVPEGATKLGVIAQYLWARQQTGYGRDSHALAMGRAKPKEHGAPQDKYFVGVPKGKVIVIEDVTTTGGSSIKTLESLREAGIDIVALVSLTNRMEKRDDGSSVEQAVTAAGFRFHHMSNALDLLPGVYRRLQPGEAIGKVIEAEFAQYGVRPLHLL
jgi:orotate phosphoribosyltransferase